MKKVIYFLSLLWSCAYLLPLHAQNAPCKADFDYQVNGNTVYLKSYNTTNHAQFHYWSFGDGQSSDNPNPTHSYQVPGQYRVLHFVKDSLENCHDSVSKIITIGSPNCTIEASFVAVRDSLDCRKVYFKNTSTPISPNAHFVWKFGDGTTSNEVSPTHVYVTDGNYTACLVIESGACRKENCKLIEIRCSTPPPCNFEVKFNWKFDEQNPLKVWFADQTGIPPGTAKYKWSFGDGTSSEDQNPVHQYLQPGTYTVCLKVYSNNNCIKDLCKTIVVLSVCNLQAGFEWRKDSIQSNKIYFKSHVPPTTVAVHYKWSFGDGTGSEDANPAHVYVNPGIYTVCLVVTISNTCKVEVCKQVEVRFENCNLEPKFSWKSDPDHQRKIQFSNHTIVPSANVRYEWKFGDGTYSHEKDPSHLYERAGEYEVCLTVWIGENCKKTFCQKLVIRECEIRVKYEWKKDASLWNKIWFQNLTQPVGNIWRTWWSYGDGTTSQDFNSMHTYQQPGKYYVCLKVQSLQGCIESYCDSVIVKKPDTCENRSDFRFEPTPGSPLSIRFKPAHINLGWKYYWSFGDGSTSVAVAPLHKYNQAGLYKVCLTVVTNNNCRTTTCKEIRIGNAAVNCDSVKVKFEYKRHPEKPNQIRFYALGSSPISKQKWTITRLSLSANPFVVIEQNNPTYTFRDTGSYLVCLYATTAQGCNKLYWERIMIDKVVGGTIIGGAAVYPNPVLSMARIEYLSEVTAKTNIRVLDASGMVKLELSTSSRTGNNYINIPVDKLNNGLYLVEIRYADKLKLVKFQKS